MLAAIAHSSFYKKKNAMARMILKIKQYCNGTLKSACLFSFRFRCLPINHRGMPDSKIEIAAPNLSSMGIDKNLTAKAESTMEPNVNARKRIHPAPRKNTNIINPNFPTNFSPYFV
jgi:hypothetical protein